MSLKRNREESNAEQSSNAVEQSIYISSSIQDRSSTFVAHYSPSVSAKKLQSTPNFKSASHRVAAWRKPGTQRSLRGEPLYESGHDDDGESYAGKKLEKVLSDMKVEGAVVVARWYGGILLGPVRFNHIENCAKDAISQYLNSRTGSGPSLSQPAKRTKTEEDAGRKSALVKVLEQRDQSIDALRQHDLLKSKSASGSAPSTASTSSQTSPKKPNYQTMGVEQLARLEKARDASIQWLLRQINEAERTAKPPVEEACGTGTTHSDQVPEQ